MSKNVDVWKTLKNKVNNDDFKDINVLYRESRGTPLKGLLFEEMSVRANKRVSINTRTNNEAPREASSTITENEYRDLVRSLLKYSDELDLRTDANFLPDSCIGSITFELEGNLLEFFFLCDEEERVQQKKLLSSNALNAIEKFKNIAKMLLDAKEE